MLRRPSIAALTLVALLASTGVATASDEQRPADREPGVSEETREALEDGRLAVERLMKALGVKIDRLAEDGKRELQEALEALRERFSEPSPPEPHEPQSI